MKKRILVVDDDKDILSSLKMILEVQGYQVDVAERGQEAIKKSKTAIYDLALIDIKLGDMSGTQVLAEFQESFPDMIKIVITGYPSLENAIASLKYGADAYITKPVNPYELLRIAEEKLRERKSKREEILEAPR